MLTTATSAYDTGDSDKIATASVEEGAPDSTASEIEAVPDSKAARRRPKRDYNYFTDLRQALVELERTEENIPTPDDDVP